MVTTIARILPDSYFDLVRKFPLTRIKDDEHLAQAQEFLHNLLRQDLDEGADAYLDALSDFIENYDEENEPSSDAPPEDVLRELINSSKLSQQQLAKAVGIAQSTISAVLNGNRKLTNDHIIKLARHFNVSPAVFLPL
ncbi:MAG: helix-turn-helix domain-containing protein [Isosphaeraceae bacterium]